MLAWVRPGARVQVPMTELHGTSGPIFEKISNAVPVDGGDIISPAGQNRRELGKATPNRSRRPPLIASRLERRRPTLESVIEYPLATLRLLVGICGQTPERNGYRP